MSTHAPWARRVFASALLVLLAALVVVLYLMAGEQHYRNCVDAAKVASTEQPQTAEQKFLDGFAKAQERSYNKPNPALVRINRCSHSPL